ncbi:hypothetical protein LZ30DRAFT_405005 [Colletotrichum cereale]|nr:hypothetical protein LZ30DRAFT_405005 [Colletotrichum cereale]
MLVQLKHTESEGDREKAVQRGPADNFLGARTGDVVSRHCRVRRRTFGHTVVDVAYNKTRAVRLGDVRCVRMVRRTRRNPQRGGHPSWGIRLHGKRITMQRYHVSSQNPSSLVGESGDGGSWDEAGPNQRARRALSTGCGGVSPPPLLLSHIPSRKTVAATVGEGGLAEHVHLRVAGRVFFGEGGVHRG